MASCKNCYLFDEFELHSKAVFFETRRDVTIFILNAILNVQKYIFDYCKCDGEATCLPCDIADIFY